MDWPMDVVRAICCSGLCEDEEMALRLHTNLTGGITLYTDYSGIDCPREAMELGIAAAEKVMGWNFPVHPLRVVRTCDNGSLQDFGSVGCNFALLPCGPSLAARMNTGNGCRPNLSL